MYNFNKDSEKLKKLNVHFDRFFFNILHPFSYNPYVEKEGRKRKGYQDLPHSFTNLFVEFCRISPYHAGHIFNITFVLLIISLLFNIF